MEERFCFIWQTFQENVGIAVVTEKNRMVPDAKNKRAVAQRDRIIALSELFAVDRPNSYQFLMAASIHDRHARIDGKIFHLGGSLAHAAMHDSFTITETDSNAQLHASLETAIGASHPWYQPGMPRHRRWCRVCRDIRDVKPNDNCDICNSPTTV